MAPPDEQRSREHSTIVAGQNRSRWAVWSLRKTDVSQRVQRVARYRHCERRAVGVSRASKTAQRLGRERTVSTCSECSSTGPDQSHSEYRHVKLLRTRRRTESAREERLVPGRGKRDALVARDHTHESDCAGRLRADAPGAPRARARRIPADAAVACAAEEVLVAADEHRRVRDVVAAFADELGWEGRRAAVRVDRLQEERRGVAMAQDEGEAVRVCEAVCGGVRAS